MYFKLAWYACSGKMHIWKVGNTVLAENITFWRVAIPDSSGGYWLVFRLLLSRRCGVLAFGRVRPTWPWL